MEGEQHNDSLRMFWGIFDDQDKCDFCSGRNVYRNENGDERLKLFWAFFFAEKFWHFGEVCMGGFNVLRGGLSSILTVLLHCLTTISSLLVRI